jgi:hypothetical protein
MTIESMMVDYRLRISSYDQQIEYKKIELRTLRQTRDSAKEKDVIPTEEEMADARSEIRRLNDLRQLAFQVITDLELLTI